MTVLRLAALALLGTALLASGARAADCNSNGVDDALDTAVTFTAHTINTHTDGALALVAADLDSDGDPDALAASGNDNTVAWHANLDGHGAFGPRKVLTAAATFAIAVRAADVDADGDLDVVWAAGSSDLVAWQRNLNGAGTFGVAQAVTTAADGPSSIVAADLDADGDLDVLVSSQNDNEIAWYGNFDGAGTFGPQHLVSKAADLPLSAQAADLDADGDLDVVSASSSDDRIAWYENADGAGSFGPQQTLSQTADGASAVAAADLDSDGDLDVLAASSVDDTLAWYEKLDGLDAFGAERVISTLADFPVAVAAADLDADGDLDVAEASGNDDSVSWHENLDGAGTFGPRQTVTSLADGADAVAAADLDADGDADLLVASFNDDRLVWHENGSDDCDGNGVPDECEPDCNANGRADACDIASGASADCNTNGVPDECDIASRVSADCAANGVPDECEPDCNGNAQADSCDIAAASSADCTANGVPDECEPDCNGNVQADSCDIAAASSADCTANGVPDECEPDCNASGTADSCDLQAGTGVDCDGNGSLDDCDVAAGRGTDCDADAVLDACETALDFTAHVVSITALGVRAAVAADIDSDGDLDLLSATSADDRITWYENLDGAGTFGPARIITTSADGARSAVAVDLDLDRDLDVLAASFADDRVAWYENLDGAGTFGPARIVTASADGATSVAAADLDSDGDPDALYSSALDGRVAWHRNEDGHGTFGPEKGVSAAAPGASSACAADLDGDGDLDVAFSAAGAGKVAWHENLTGTGAFGPEETVDLDLPGAASVAAADLDGDGSEDLLAAGEDGDTVAWYPSLGGSFGARQVISGTANGAASVAAADLDGDGDADALATSLFDNHVSWFANDGVGGFGPARTITTSRSGPISVRAADLDSDGDLDVLAASIGDNTIAWYENDSQDCNGNGLPDACDTASGASRDCDDDGVPDECQPDCNANDASDPCDIASGASSDCDDDGIPDECEPDCNANGMGDLCDVATGHSLDCDANGYPDECEPDCNSNGIPDACDLAGATSADCDGNGVPDECDPDCNADGLPSACEPDCDFDGTSDGCEADCNSNEKPDDCDLAAGTSRDCDANGVPDECDTGCAPGTCDADHDRCPDALDSAPLDPFTCADADGDGCEDCSTGKFDPKKDGPDTDEDGFCSPADCAPDTADVWTDPSSIDSLVLARQDATALLAWGPPAVLGATIVRYDTLRSPLPDDFGAPATCVASDELERTASDPALPPLGAAFFYLIRVENDCPGSEGAMGEDSNGVPHTGRPCP